MERTKKVLAWAAILLFQAGCKDSITDQDYDRQRTIAILNEWAHLLEIVIKNDLEDLMRYSTCEEVLAAWRKKAFVDDQTLARLEVDGWGRSFHWRTDKKKKLIAVRSGGKDGVLHNGHPDGLFVELTSVGGHVTVRYGRGK
jgi:hypothetical protein